jgi:hypothetical protein
MSCCQDTYYNLPCGCCSQSPCCCDCPPPCPPTTTTTTTINPDCEPCEEFYNCECVLYTGENVECYGLKNGDNLCEVLETIIQNLPECRTTLPPPNCSFTVSVTIV